MIETIREAVREADATLIVASRNASHWTRLLTGDMALSLMMNVYLSLMVVPDPAEVK